jgi:ribosomal protein S18 acetylase RimI-like enzyme
MDIVFRELTKELMLSKVTELMKISVESIADEYWDRQHFLSDLNRKWELSFLVTDKLGNVRGFLIASEKVESVHIHKFVVTEHNRSKGLGTRMLDYLKGRIAKPITLKVNSENKTAIAFYLKKGFVVTSENNNLYNMKLGEF